MTEHFNPEEQPEMEPRVRYHVGVKKHGKIVHASYISDRTPEGAQEMRDRHEANAKAHEGEKGPLTVEFVVVKATTTFEEL